MSHELSVLLSYLFASVILLGLAGWSVLRWRQLKARLEALSKDEA